MTRPVLVLRPQPSADATAARAAERGLRAVVAPLFRIVPRDWTMPKMACDALLITSANAAGALDDRLDRRTPVYAVGEATAAAVRSAGFESVIAGPGHIDGLVPIAAANGVRSLLHLAGEHRTAFDPAGLRIETRTVYAAEPVAPPPAFAAALLDGAVALLHSARAARRFRELAGPGHRIAAISDAVICAAGEGWKAGVVADRPTDDALLAAAARLCQ
ncbi:putative uroporphyrinogen-III synthase [Sphingomonas changbaiensis NBRC 104936]|uniref:Putative uroporphyrinogen-III synthase n=1 Tax=Sphingomonas changbaiensis NBRC 104936 TaxID=1219043 RepID=A0A0E9MT23_9SPHN|nr:uroporphyrinogen-III synthase [Sphingomonas changbaiensis]GAO40285.1 putative uroporphyrinogen-III synthase [Sphingomonas changbaiensis NBRC 104936]